MTGVFVDADDNPTEEIEDISNQDVVSEAVSQNIEPPTSSDDQNTQLQKYRINESCELLYAMTVGEYPNGERLQSLSITGVVAKYQNDFEPWLDTFMDEEKMKAFVTGGFSPEFLNVFSLAVMKEYSINPELQPIVYAALDPNGGDAKINDLFNEDGCSEYFAQRQGSQAP